MSNHFYGLTPDCIGSAFNAKGRMQCPNCRHVEQGQWLYANGCFLHEDFVDDFTMDEEEIYTGAANLVGRKLKMLSCCSIIAKFGF